MDTVLLLAQALATGQLAGWLTLGVRDNILHPAINETYTSEVMAMTRLAREYPAEYAQLQHRAVHDRRTHILAFRLVIVTEVVASVLLWLGCLALLGAAVALIGSETARSLAMFAAMSFTTVWACFLIVGNHFCYWFCHEGAQNTHYQMTLWGLGTMILIAIG